MHDQLFVFDIETIPDTDAVPNLTDEDGDVAARRQALTDYHLKVTDGRNDFPRQPFHKIVAISFLAAEIEKTADGERYHLTEVRSGGEVDSDEETLVKGVFQYLAKARPRFVSYNGRGFDLPVMRFRAMKYGVSARWLYQSGSKWDSYTSRYSSDWHCDLADVLKDYGAMSGGLKLNEVCSILGLPGKFGPDGSKVTEMYDAGDIVGIRNYCETDVLNTYLVYLSHQKHVGMMSEAAHEAAVADVLAYLKAEAPERSHLGDFLKAWEEAGQ